MRKARIERKTRETNVEVELKLDGKEKYEIEVELPFFKHLLELFAKNALVDLRVKASGDLEHHTVEDVAICMGKALKEALGDKRGIARYGFFVLPMDESAALAAIDLSGRSSLVFKAGFERERVEGLSTELVQEFFKRSAGKPAVLYSFNCFLGGTSTTKRRQYSSVLEEHCVRQLRQTKKLREKSLRRRKHYDTGKGHCGSRCRIRQFG